MKSVVLKSPEGTGAAAAAVMDLPLPVPGPGEILVEMMACGLCGTDVEKIRGHYTASMPVLGHEAAGVVAAVGRGTDDFHEGDRVFPHHHVPCYGCYFCRHGSETMCERYRTSNLVPGGFSEFFVVPEWNLSKGGVLKLPDSVGFEQASMIEPAACCIRALRRCPVAKDDTVLVVGAGPVGMMHSLILSAREERVIVSDVSEWRLDFAERIGMKTLVNARKEDTAEAVRRETGGRGADLVVVATGDLKAIAQGLGSVRKGGTVLLFGVPAAGSSLDYDISKVYNSEVSVLTSYGAVEADTSEALRLIAGGGVDFSPLVTNRFPVSRFPEALEAATGGRAMKVLLTR